MGIEQEFARAQHNTQEKLRLVNVIRALPAGDRRTFVFEALILAEGSATNGTVQRRGPGRPPGSKNKTNAERKPGTYDTIVDLLKANPEMPVPEIAKAVYGDVPGAIQRVHTALFSMKNKRVKKMKKRGAWRAI